MRTLVRGGTVVSAAGEYRADVLIEGETILAVGLGLESGVNEIVDVDGSLVLPGLIDSHTHIGSAVTRAPQAFERGTAGALLGGTTTVIDFACQTDGSLIKGLDHWGEQAAEGSHVDYGFHLIVDDVTDDALDEIQSLIDRGVTSLKLFMSGAKMKSDTDLLRVLRRTVSTGGLVQVHAENGSVIAINAEDALVAGHTSAHYHAVTRPPSTEADAVAHAIHLSGWARRPVFFVHISTADALAEIHRARGEGRAVYGETCVHYLILTEDELKRPGIDGAKYMCAPPLRTTTDQEALWSALRQQVLSACTTDHCAHSITGGKDRIAIDFAHVPNGLPSVQHRLVLLYEQGVRRGKLTLSELVNITSTSPAQLFDIPRKGAIAPGMDADLVILDPDGHTRISAKADQTGVDYSPYEGYECRGAVSTVFSRGKRVVADGALVSSPGRGRFLHRGLGAFGPGDLTTL